MKLVEIHSDPVEWLQWCYGIGNPEFPAVTASLAAFISSIPSKLSQGFACAAVNKGIAPSISDHKAHEHGLDITKYVPFCIQSTLNPWIRSTTEGVHAFGKSALLVRPLSANQADIDLLFNECQWVHLAADNEFKEVVVLHLDHAGDPVKVTKVRKDKERQQLILATANKWRSSKANQNAKGYMPFTQPFFS